MFPVISRLPRSTRLSSSRVSLVRTARGDRPLPQRSFGVIASRRSRRALDSPKAATTTSAASPSTSPTPDTTSGWPTSVRVAGYGLAATLGPYSLLWLLAQAPPELHQWLGLSEPQLQWLREYFGVDDDPTETVRIPVETEQTVIRRKRLVLEPQWEQRRLAHTQAQLDGSTVSVRISRWDDAVSANGGAGQTDVSVLLELPASLPCREETLRDYLREKSDLCMVGPSTKSTIVGIDFVESSSPVALDGDISSEADSMTDESTVDGDSLPSADPLLRQTAIYSTWYHHSGPPTAASTTTPLAPQPHGQDQNHQARIDQLQTEIRLLEDELHGRNHTSMRDVDEIQLDLKDRRAQLRKLQWRRWVPW